MGDEPSGLDPESEAFPTWAALEAASEALHVRSFTRLVDGQLLRAAVRATGGGAWLPDIDGLITPGARGHVVRGAEERIVGLRLVPWPVVNDRLYYDAAATTVDEPGFAQALPLTLDSAGPLSPRADCGWEHRVELRVVGVGELIANAVFIRLRQGGDTASGAQVRAAVHEAVDEVWETAQSAELHNPVARLAQLRRIAFPDHGLCEGTTAGLLAQELSAWPNESCQLPFAQLNVGADVDDEGRLTGRGPSWSSALSPFSHHDPPRALADGARAAARAMTPVRRAPPLFPGRLAGAPVLGVDLAAALVPLPFGDPALIVSSDLVASGRLDCIDYSGRTHELAPGDVLVDRHGTGGVIAEVRASHELPRLVDGTPVDVLLDPVHIVRWRRFGTLAELEASAQTVYEPAGSRPIDALAGRLHVLRQVPHRERRNSITIINATLTSAGREPDRPGNGAVVDAVAIPDPELAHGTCGVPRGFWSGHLPPAALLMGSRPGEVQRARVVPIDGDDVHVPLTARALFVAPWTGELVTIAPTIDQFTDPVAGPAPALIGRRLPRRVTLSALRPVNVQSMLADAPATLFEIDSQYDRGIVTADERAQAATDKLNEVFAHIAIELEDERQRDPEGLVAAFARINVRGTAFAPVLIDREGRGGGPWLADYLGGVSDEVLRSADAPHGPAIDWEARARALSERLIKLCGALHVTETDCGTVPPAPDERSALECRTRHGVCVACLDSHGTSTPSPPVGTPVGLLGAIALTRVLPDLWLRTYHVCGTHLSAQHGLLRFEELVDGRPTPRAAVLAEHDGTVQWVDDGVAVLSADRRTVQFVHHARHRRFDVRDGTQVEAGSPLTVGAIPLPAFARLKGSRAVDRYVADDMTSLLEGKDVPPPLVACVVRSIRAHWPWATYNR